MICRYLISNNLLPLYSMSYYISKYIHNIKKSQMTEQFIKLLIIGDSGVGKSSILSRYCQDKFSTAFYNTIGVDFVINTNNIRKQSKQFQTIQNVKCKQYRQQFIIQWDTAGQERFRTITSNYYRGAHGILIVFDVTSKISFKDVQFWVTQIQRNGSSGDIVTILVGNKCDMVGKREVSEEQANNYARKNNLEYIQVSALNSSNVSLVFQTISKHVLRKKQGNTQKQKKQEQNEVGNKTMINLTEKKKKFTQNCC